MKHGKTVNLYKQLNRLNIQEFDNNNLQEITYHVTTDGFDIDFWNIDQVVTHFEGYTDLRPLRVRIMPTLSGRIHCSSFYREIRDINTLTIQELAECKNQHDFLNLVRNKAAVGLRIVA